MPSRLGRVSQYENDQVQGTWVRVQVNYKHAELPAIKILNKALNLAIGYKFEPKLKMEFKHASQEDLYVDKLLTMPREGKGRERLKDAYDLALLSRQNLEIKLIKQKLWKIAGFMGTEPQTILEETKGGMRKFMKKTAEALGLRGTTAYEGRGILDNWDHEMRLIEEKVREIQRRI